MSYNSINLCAHDPAFVGRVNAAAAKEGIVPPEPAAASVIWPVSAAGDIEAAYESALANDNPNPGGDESVITDLMILSAFQAAWPPTAPAAPPAS